MVCTVNSSYVKSQSLVQNLCKFSIDLNPSQTSPVFSASAVKPFENTVGKGEIAHNKQFLLFPNCFVSFCKTFSIFNKLRIVVLNSFSLEEFKIFPFGKELNIYQIMQTLATLGKKAFENNVFLFSPTIFSPY